MLATTTATSSKSMLVGGLTAVPVAAAAAATIAATGEFAGISLDVGGAPIPVYAFAVLTVFFSTIGLVLAVVLARWARRPRMVFVRTTITLTALSLVPDVLADAPLSTKVLLMGTHLVAASIMIPAVARRLSA